MSSLGIFQAIKRLTKPPVAVKMCNSQREDLNLWLSDFVKRRGYSKFDLLAVQSSSKGDGYLGEVTFVKVQTDEKIYNLVIKSAKKSEKLRYKMPIRDVFKREIFMYTKVFPAFESLQLERSIERPFWKYPKCYTTFNDNLVEVLILQNMKELKFQIHDRRTPQDLKHVLLAFQNYAKFHALSLALKHQKPQEFESLTLNMPDVLIKIFIQGKMFRNLAQIFQEALDSSPGHKELFNFDEEAIKKIVTKEQDPGDGLQVILHGDCWNNNMMFRYSDIMKKGPSDMVFLDFQLASLGSPIYDLSYYLYSVADGTVLEHHELLLQTYLDVLLNSLEELQVASPRVNLEDLKRHWKEYGKFGLVMASFIIKLELAESDEVVDLAECAETGDISNAFASKISNTEAYASRVRSVFKHYSMFL